MKNRGKWAISLGLLLIAAALLLVAYNVHDSLRAGQTARSAAVLLEAAIPTPPSPSPSPAPADAQVEVVPEREISVPDYVLNPDMDMPVETVDGMDYIGILRIPVLGLELPVISQWSYPGLQIAPCRYSGSAYAGNLVIAGHNYPAHFGNLKDLAEGDILTFTDMDGNTFTYETVVREILEPAAVDEMESGGWDLTLFTCTVGGRNRITIRCDMIAEEAAG